MKNSVLSFISLLVLGIAIWWMGANVIWLGDDLDYKYMMKGELWESWGKIKTIKAFFQSQSIHYHNVNGRFVAHAIVQLFNACIGQQAFAVCNAFVYILFAVLLGKAGKVRLRDNSGGVISAICLSVLCFITKMMPTCQIGYIWGMVANLTWLMLFYRSGRPSWLSTTAMMLAGIIVGNWQESVSIGVCAGVGIWWIVRLFQRRKSSDKGFDWRRSWMLLGYVAGTASNCFAPSTMGRVSDISMPLTDEILIVSYSIPAILMLACMVIYFGVRHRRIRLSTFKSEEGDIPDGVLVIAVVMLTAFSLVIGVYSNRQLFGANLFAAILFLRILPRHRFCLLMNILSSLAVIAFWILMIHGIAEVRRQYDGIMDLHSKSTDGSVYYDRKRVMTLGFPLRAKYFEDILGLFDNDLHHSLMKDLKQTRKGKTLKLKPTVPVEDERVDRYAPGHFTVTLKEPPKGEAPRKIMIFGHYMIPGIAATPRIMEVTRYSKRSQSYSVAVIVPEYPFFMADSIAIMQE
ncbi:MAG: hypothetical protein K2H22_03180 [Muribaculaceae bacterium]|nr:hypothetical protein [Muribaculaceae bacterium]